MNDITTNVVRAIADFDGIKTAIEDCGVPVGNTSVDQYDDKIELIGQTNNDLLFTSNGRPYTEKVVIPDGTAKLGDYAYEGCTGLTEIKIPESVTAIGISALSGTGIKEVTIPNAGAVLNNSCFSNCAKLVSVSLPGNLQKLSPSALYNASSLQTLVLPDSITTLEMSSINTCRALKTIHFPLALKTIALSNLRYCGLEEAILPEGVETIGSNVLRDCPNLKKVFLPASLTTIDEGFMLSDNLLEEVILGNGFGLSLDISMSTKYSVQVLLDCLYAYADRSGQEALVFTIGVQNLSKLNDVYVLENPTGLEIVESTTVGAMLAEDYAAGKNITLR